MLVSVIVELNTAVTVWIPASHCILSTKDISQHTSYPTSEHSTQGFPECIEAAAKVSYIAGARTTLKFWLFPPNKLVNALAVCFCCVDALVHRLFSVPNLTPIMQLESTSPYGTTASVFILLFSILFCHIFSIFIEVQRYWPTSRHPLK